MGVRFPPFAVVACTESCEMVKASTPPAPLGLARVESRAAEGPQLDRVRDVLDCSLSPA